ncbi:DUF5999 family protein [Streptomyces sp. NPDC051907]|uniref:DUF5999 family protein n=1 Tax=Streptomyces sp. NPDC051907 TaxID=3155284 RepID=UPI00343EE272
MSDGFQPLRRPDASKPEQGWSPVCNGASLFEDTGVSRMAKAPQIRIRRPVRPRPARDLDLRTPSGRVLPY